MVEEFDCLSIQWKVICVLYQTNTKQILIDNTKHKYLKYRKNSYLIKTQQTPDHPF
jgi:hypothetical protein